MDCSPTASCTASSPGLPTGKTRTLALIRAPLAALLLGACASAPPIEQGGPVLDANAAISCPHGTVVAAGQTQGRLSAVWCEKPDGKRHGPYIEWWENHQKKAAGPYRDGVRHGQWSFFLNNGQRDSLIEYRNGETLSSTGTPQPPQP